jgi:glycosyltransferase involved in cell wall biosynthesis
MSASALDSERLAAQTSRLLVRTVENGVDLDHFRSQHLDSDEDGVLWIGPFDDPANMQAFRLLIDEVWPHVRASRQQAKLTVVAGENYRLNWRRRFRSAFPELPAGVTVLGRVGDARPLYERASVVMALVAAGAGSSPHVLEALAMGRAVVAAKAACEGLAVEPGRDLLVATSPAEFAAAVEKLLADPALRRQLSEHGRSAIARYDWNRSVEQQLAIYEELLRKKG